MSAAGVDHRVSNRNAVVDATTYHFADYDQKISLPPRREADGEYLDQISLLNDFRRKETTRNLVHWCVLAMCVVAFLASLAMFSAWVWHCVASPGYEWLAPEKWGTLDRLVQCGLAFLFGGFILKYLSKQLN